MIHEAISKVAARQDLTEAEMAAVMEQISEGRATPVQIGALIVALGMKGESVDEITGTVKVLRNKKRKVPVIKNSSPLVDTCGTGGDGTGTFNISTTAAFVAAGCGLRVAKHGNRSVSSHCGSADVMEALGVNLDLGPAEMGDCINQAGIGFLFAPALHPAMGHALHPRRELGIKSIFNLVGPLTNPADASVQVLGVYRRDLTETAANVLKRLGCSGAMVVHGLDGMDEITITGPTQVTALKNGQIDTTVLTPEDLGLKRAPLADITGKNPEHNAALTMGVLSGEKGPARDVVLMNAAAVLTAAGRVPHLKEGVRMAAEAIDSGRALEKLKTLAELSHKLAARKKAVGE